MPILVLSTPAERTPVGVQKLGQHVARQSPRAHLHLLLIAHKKRRLVGVQLGRQHVPILPQNKS